MIFGTYDCDQLADLCQQRPDCGGECDGCHREGALWTDYDDCGEFQFCQTCIRGEIKRRRDKMEREAFAKRNCGISPFVQSGGAMSSLAKRAAEFPFK